MHRLTHLIRSPILFILLMAAALAASAPMFVHAAPAEPAPKLAITKVGSPSPAAPGSVISYTIYIENSGDSDAREVQVIDQLPGGTIWAGVTSKDCKLKTAEDFVTQVLQCSGIYVQQRHLNETQSNFENGLWQVSVFARAGDVCGLSYSNGALMLFGGTATTSNTAVIKTPDCPPPPTPTPTATPTSQPTATPTNPPPTATPTNPPPTSTAIPTATATPIRIAPLPPNTGNGDTPTSAGMDLHSGFGYYLVLYGLIGMWMIVGGAIAYRRISTRSGQDSDI
jgi:uncharacterized repeat protein (TIGR01451 family)